MTKRYQESSKQKWERKRQEHVWQLQRTICSVGALIMSSVTLLAVILSHIMGG